MHVHIAVTCMYMVMLHVIWMIELFGTIAENPWMSNLVCEEILAGKQKRV